MIGGMHKQTLYLAKYLDRTKFDIIVLTQNTSTGGLRDEFLKTGCKILDLGRNSIPQKKKNFSLMVSFKLRTVLKNEDIDIIYLNAAPNLIYFLIAKLFLTKKIEQIGSFRALTFWKGHLKNSFVPIDNFFAKLLYRTSRITVVNSFALAAHYSKILNIDSKKPLVVINNGSDFDFEITKSMQEVRDELGLIFDELFVIMAARLDPWKDFETVIEAASIISKRNKKIKFVIMGDGYLRSHIEDMIHKYSLGSQVLLIGEKSDSINYINASDISILSTHGEGFSNSILESMALGKPVIATNVGGNAEMLGTQGEFGFLIDKKGADQLVSKIEMLFKDEELRLKIGKAASYKIRQLCDMENYVKKYETLFRELVNSSQRA